MAGQLLPIHEEILRILSVRQASYAAPIPSVELATALNVAPSYIRQQVALLRAMKVVGVRRGRGGGYYLRRPSAVSATAGRDGRTARRSQGGSFDGRARRPGTRP